MIKLLKESDNKISGNPISFIDIDETTMHTFAKVNVMKDGKIVKKLDNKEFNTHTLGDGETYNFDNFRDAKFFRNTSQPIEKTINRIKDIIQSIKDNNKQEKVIFLTARSDFDDKEVFLDTFRNFGIDVDIPNVHVERSGNLTNIKNVADRKKYVILKYLKSGLYTAVKMYDDDKKNLQTFLNLGQEVNDGKYGILKNVKEKFPKIDKINFYPLLVNNSGKIKKITENIENDNIILEAINAYHGSHKDFEKFDTKYIGTGESCQAHGWGLYFALKPETSKEYQSRISDYHINDDKNKTSLLLSYNGKTFDPNTVQGKMIKMIYTKGKYKAIKFLENLSKESQFTKNPESFKENIRKLYNMIRDVKEKEIKEKIKVKRGQFFTVEIPELEYFLDEDKKMSQQSPYIISSVKKLLKELNYPFKAKDLNGEDFYNKLKYYSLESGSHFDSGYNNIKDISNFLFNHGIVGIKYNGQSDGDCVVVFNNKDVKIIKKDIDYNVSNDDGIEMTKITKFIEDPKKLKNKSVSSEIIDWFIENKPDMIPGEVIRTKFTLEQKLKYSLYADTSYTPTMSEIEQIKKSNPDMKELPLVELKNYFENTSSEKINYNYIMEIVKSIPLEVKKEYILKNGNRCFYPFIYDERNDDKQNEINKEFFNGLTLDDVKNKLNKSSKYTIIADRERYNEYNDALKYLILDSEYNFSYEGFYIQTPIDDSLINYLNENRDGKDHIIYLNNDDLMDKKRINKLKELSKYNKNGNILIVPYDITEEPIKEIYTDDIIETYNQCSNSKELPKIIINLINYPSILKNLKDELFNEICSLLSSKKFDETKILDIKELEQLNHYKRQCIINKFLYYLKTAGNKYYKNYKAKIKELIQNNLMNNKDLIIKIANLYPDFLSLYNNLPYNMQKAICLKNPYLIRYIKNPDKKLVNELKNKYENIDNYINYDGEDYDFE